ncbi:MAG: TAXI family TRAP transporter solute-binding subunit [Defluviicoccus sp.]
MAVVRWWPLRSVFLALLLTAAVQHVQAQSAEEWRDKVNRGTIGLITSSAGGRQPHLAADLAAALDAEGRLRIVPMLGRGPVQTVTDLLYLRGADIAIVPADVLAIVRSERHHANIDKRLAYLAPLYSDVLYVLARGETGSISQLAGQPVNLGPPGSSAAVTAAHVLDTLGIPVEPASDELPAALARLRHGEIAAIVWLGSIPAPALQALRPDDDIRFLNVPMIGDLGQVYLPAILTADDYPGLIAANSPVSTVAVPQLLVVAAGDRQAAERARRLKVFVDALFGDFGRLLAPGRDPAWREINLAAVAPGWTRSAVAEEWLRANVGAAVTPLADAKDQELRPALDEFLQFLETKDLRGGFATLSEEERGVLFLQFQQWRERRAQPPR